MEKEIARVVRANAVFFVLFLLLPVAVVVGGELCESLFGYYAGEIRAVYFAETGCILLTALFVPLSLKLFTWVLPKRMDVVGIEVALHRYLVWSVVRLCLLAVPVLVGLATYYLMLSGKGVLCAAVSLTASCFCMPSARRLRNELNLGDNH